MNHTRRYGPVFGLALVACLLATLPAGYLLPTVQRALPEVALGPVTGSLWTGRVQGVRYRQWQARELTWSLRLMPLLLGRIEARFATQGEGADITGHIGRRLGGDIYLADIDARLGIKTLQAMGVIKFALPTSGTATLALDTLHVINGTLRDLRGEIDVTDLQLETPLVDLGDYHIAIEPLQEGFQATLSDRDAALQAQGVALINTDGSYRFTGDFAARANAPEALVQSMRLFGNPGPDGRVNVVYAGKL